MAETIIDNRWDVKKDLEKPDFVKIGSLKISPAVFSGINILTGSIFFAQWKLNSFLVIDITKDDWNLINSFSEAVEYQPFCRYDNCGLDTITFEWRKEGADACLGLLERKGAKNLVKFPSGKSRKISEAKAGKNQAERKFLPPPTEIFFNGDQ